MTEKRRIINAICVLAALVLFGLASFLRSAERVSSSEPEAKILGISRFVAGDICKDVGIVILSIALLDWLWAFFGGEPLSKQISALGQRVTDLGSLNQMQIATLQDLNQLTHQANITGLKKIGRNRYDLMVPMEQYVKQAKQGIDFCAYTLYILQDRGSLRQAIVERAQTGVKVRLLVVDAENPFLSETIEETTLKVMKRQIQSTIKALKTDLRTLPNSDTYSIEIRKISKGPMLISVLRVDDEMIVFSYLASKQTPETPMLVLQGPDKPLFKTYADEFEFYYKNAERIWPETASQAASGADA